MMRRRPRHFIFRINLRNKNVFVCRFCGKTPTLILISLMNKETQGSNEEISNLRGREFRSQPMALLVTNSSLVSSKQMKKQRAELIGLYFAGESAKAGFIPLLTTRNISGIDMMVSNEDGSKTATFHVKAIRLPSNKWFSVCSMPKIQMKTHI